MTTEGEIRPAPDAAPDQAPPPDAVTAGDVAEDDSGGGAAMAGETSRVVDTDPEVPEAPGTAADPAEPSDDPAGHRFECRSCGFVYDPAEGIAKYRIPPGTPFADLDAASFRCPVCRSRKPLFTDIGPRDKPSGFEENLNYGLGVNRLTPGQKNVLIFGGFALAFAFFLSLYSLR